MEKESNKKYKDSISSSPEDKKSSFTIHDLPQSERPRERLKRFGPEALSAQEILALIIGRGIPRKSVVNIAQEILTKFKNIKGIAQATLEELSQVKGIGLAKAAQIKACFELAKRQDLEPELKDFSIKSPESVVKAVRATIKDKAKEHFKLILLNTRKKIIGISTISIGTLDANLVHPREVLKDAISHNAASVILVHAEAFFYAGYIEKWGGGTLKVIRKCIDSGLPEPGFFENMGMFGVTLRKISIARKI